MQTYELDLLYDFLAHSWPLILDPDSKSIRWINNVHRSRIVRQIQQGENEEEIAATLTKCIRGGDVAIFYDVVSYDSCFDSVLTKKVITKNGKRFMRVRDEDIPYSDEFKLYMIYRGTSEEMMPEYELQTRCTIVDFNFTKECMNNYFMDIVSECEMPSKRQEFLLISDREVEAINNSQKSRDKIERLFGEAEANLLLDNVNIVNSIFETMKVFDVEYLVQQRLRIGFYLNMDVLLLMLIILSSIGADKK